MFHLRKSSKFYPIVTVWLACLLVVSSSLPVPLLNQFQLFSVRSAYAEATYSAQDLDALMKKLLDGNISEINKQRITAVLFYHTDTYRDAVIKGKLPADSPQVQAFLKYKEKLQVDVIEQVCLRYKNTYGRALKQPVIPFSYNNILSDDDVVTGTGKVGRLLEKYYREALSDLIQQRAGRPMTAADRQRIDVNGLAWNMTQDGAFQDFRHPEKYINPQSGFANQAKLVEGAEAGKVKAYISDEQGRLVRLNNTETVEAIKRLQVDRPLEIPGVDMKIGSGQMSDFLRMAQMHRLKFQPGKTVRPEEIIQFIRNQKYSQRVIGPFNQYGAAVDPELAKKYASFIRVSDALRDQTTMRGVAQVLEAEYGVKILDPNGVVDFERLTTAMKTHQTLQLTEALPKMMGAVTKSEVYKIAQWLKSASGADRLTLRKQLALTYAPLTDGQRAVILNQIERVDIPEPDKAFVRRAMDQDAKQIQRYAQLLELETHTLTGQLKLHGDNHAVVDYTITKNAKVRAFVDSVASRPGGSRFNQFLKSKTARALNLDVMLDITGERKGQKLMTWSMLLLACTRAYSAAADEKEGLKQMGMAAFQMVPLVASVLRLSEGEFRESFKELAMDILPPLALANLAFMALDYTAREVKSGWDETVWEGLVREALRELNDDDFEKTDMGYYRLKERGAYFEYIQDVSSAFGRVAKLASMVAPEVEAMMSRHKTVQTNNAALHTLQWFEEFDPESQATYWAKQFDIDEIKKRVWDQGMLSRGSASPVERVAAKLLLENMAIRLDLQNQVLSSFIDRIEERYNDLKGEVTGDCSQPGMIGSAVEMVTGPDAEECDPNAIVMETMAVLKGLFNSPPPSVADSPWGMAKLEEEYTRIIGYLKDYTPEGKSQLDLRKEMQEIIETFKAFIQDLVLAVALNEELRYLDLTVYCYGGDESHAATTAVLQGDSARFGMSARVSPTHADERDWQVFYYAARQNDPQVTLIGRADLDPRHYDPGTEGLWVIEAPEPDTYLTLRRGDVGKHFAEEGTYQVVAVLAFGDWSDPIAQVGYAALRQPIEYATLFSPERVAFASEALTFNIEPAQLRVKPKKPHFSNEEMPEIEFYLSVPEYAYDKRYEVTMEAFAPEEAPAPECYPPEMTDVSFDQDQPSVFNLVLSPDALEGMYYVDVAAEIRGFASEFQPLAQTVSFQYFHGESATDEEPVQRDALLTQLRELQGRSQAAYDKAAMNYDMLVNERKDALRIIDDREHDLKKTDKLVTVTERAAAKVDDHMATVRKDATQTQVEAEKAAENRGLVQDYALKCCQVAETVKNTRTVDRLEDLIQDVRLAESDVRLYAKRFRTNLHRARLASEEAQKIAEAMGSLQADRTQAVNDLNQVASAVDVLAGDVQRLKKLSSIISENAVIAAEVRVQADAIFNEIVAVNKRKKAAETWTAQDKEFTRSAEEIVSRISYNEKKVVSFDEKGKRYLREPESDFERLRTFYVEVKSRVAALVEMPSISDEQFARFQHFAKEARVAYDSTEIFEDSVSESVRRAGLCLDAAEAHFDQETSPQAQVAKKDCSEFPGTSAQWVESKQRVECWCPAGSVWDKPQNRCINQQNQAMQEASCRQYPGTHKVWNAQKQVVECHCPSRHVWDQRNNRCKELGWKPRNQRSNTNRSNNAQGLIKGLQDLMKAAQDIQSGSSGSSGTSGTSTGSSGTGRTESSGSGSGSSGGTDYGEGCAPPGKWDGSCCRCPDGSCEYFGQGCAY